MLDVNGVSLEVGDMVVCVKGNSVVDTGARGRFFGSDLDDGNSSGWVRWFVGRFDITRTGGDNTGCGMVENDTWHMRSENIKKTDHLTLSRSYCRYGVE